jgi:hypothetical protein
MSLIAGGAVDPTSPACRHVTGRGKGALRSNKAPLIHCGKELSNYNKRLLLGGR